MDHLTVVLLAFVTSAVNCIVCPEYRTGAVGLTRTLIGGLSVTALEPVVV